MLESPQLKQLPDGRITLTHPMPCGRYRRYTFSGTRTLILFARSIHTQVELNLAILSQAGPVPRGKLQATQMLLETLHEITLFIDWHAPQNAWSPELTEVVLNAVSRSIADG
jgi:hypothetical protein